MSSNERPEFEPHRQEFGQMPGINGNEVSPSFHELSHSDTTRRGLMWSSISVGILVTSVGLFALGDWLHWF